MHGFACRHRGSGRRQDAAPAQRLQNARHGCSRGLFEKSLILQWRRMRAWVERSCASLGSLCVSGAYLSMGLTQLPRVVKFSIVASLPAPAAAIPIRK